MLKDLLLGYMIARTFFLLYTLLIVVSIEFLFTLKTLLCTLILLHDKHMIMLLLSHATIFPKNIIELDPDSDDQDFYILGPEPIKRKPPLMFTPSQIKTTIRPNTFTAQDAGIYCNAEINQFWNRTFFPNILILLYFGKSS